jgi:hypothetical protein
MCSRGEASPQGSPLGAAPMGGGPPLGIQAGRLDSLGAGVHDRQLGRPVGARVVAIAGPCSCTVVCDCNRAKR